MRRLNRIIAIITAIACLSISVSACSSLVEKPAGEAPETESRITGDAESAENDEPGSATAAEDPTAKKVWDGSIFAKKAAEKQYDEELLNERRDLYLHIRAVVDKTLKYSDRYNAYTLNLLRSTSSSKFLSRVHRT